MTRFFLSDAGTRRVLARGAGAAPAPTAPLSAWMKPVGRLRLTEPAGLAVDAQRGVLLADAGSPSVALWSGRDRRWTRLAAGFAARLTRPLGTAFRGAQMLVLQPQSIVAFEGLDGTGWAEFGAAGRPTAADPEAVGRFADAFAVAVDASQAVWISDPGAGRLVRLDAPDGTGWQSIALPAEAAPALPLGLAAFDEGVVVLDAANRRLLVLGPDGSLGASLPWPADWAGPCWVAASGRELLVADVLANTVRFATLVDGELTPAGELRGSPPQQLQPLFTRIGGLAA